MEKPTICIGENKGAAKLISAFVFATRIVQFLFYLNPKFEASSPFLCLYRPVCVGPVRKPHCWFSHEAAQMITMGESIHHLHWLTVSELIRALFSVLLFYCIVIIFCHFALNLLNCLFTAVKSS